MVEILRKIKALITRKLRGEITIEDLVNMGLKVGKNFSKQNGCIIDTSHCWLITIGDNVTLAHRVHILAHDASTKMFLNYTKIGAVQIGNNVFVGAGSIILPNVKIGNNVIIGAGSIVSKDICDNVVVAGNPAKEICSIENYLEKNKRNMENRPVYNDEWTIQKNISNIKKIEMAKALKNGVGYVE